MAASRLRMAERALSGICQGALEQPVLRALRLIEAHPAVVQVTAVRSTPDDGFIRATVEIRTEMANGWRAAGVSPSGVREVEPVSFTFSKSFPLFAPRITLRTDFNRSHPHLQPSSLEHDPEPCLVAGSPRELMRLRGMEGLLEQLVLWLDKAATAELIDPKQGWEPVRRDYLDDLIVADASWLTSLPTLDSRCVAFKADYYIAGTGSAYRISLPKSDPVALGPKLADEWRYRSFQSGGRSGNTHALVAWSGKRPNGQRFIADRYLPETVATVDELLTRGGELGCREVLEAKLRLLTSRLSAAQLEAGLPIAVLLLARRPCEVIGTFSLIELCPYVIEIRGGDALSAGSGKTVRTAMHRDEISPELLKRASGDATQSTRPWSLLGCGSVGSKMALHLARAGCGPASIVDNADMQPHNFARHATLPSDTKYEALCWVPKTHHLAETLAPFGQKPAAHYTDIVGHTAQTKTLAPLYASESFAAVNATGSASVREALCLPDVAADRPRIVEACLLGIGRVGLMTVEGTGANPSSTDLMCEAYRLMLAQNEWRKEVFNTQGEAIAIGQGCSAVTMPLSDASLSTLVAPMAAQFRVYQRTGLPKAGEVLLGRVAADGLGQDWQRTDVPPRLIIGDPQGITVRLSPAVDENVRREVARHPGSETGGILVGRYSDVGNCFHVVDSLPAPPDSRFSRNEFVLGTEGLKPMVRNLIEGSGGALYVLGTWHNHLIPSGPSGLDKRTAALLALRQYFPVLMLISTPTGYTHLFAEALPALVPTGIASEGASS